MEKVCLVAFINYLYGNEPSEETTKTCIEVKRAIPCSLCARKDVDLSYVVYTIFAHGSFAADCLSKFSAQGLNDPLGVTILRCGPSLFVSARPRVENIAKIQSSSVHSPLSIHQDHLHSGRPTDRFMQSQTTRRGFAWLSKEGLSCKAETLTWCTSMRSCSIIRGTELWLLPFDCSRLNEYLSPPSEISRKVNRHWQGITYWNNTMRRESKEYIKWAKTRRLSRQHSSQSVAWPPVESIQFIWLEVSYWYIIYLYILLKALSVYLHMSKSSKQVI